MKLGFVIGAGVVTVAGGMFLAWSLDDRTAQASIDGADSNVISVDPADKGIAAARISALATFDDFWGRISKDPYRP